jgi:hypothetical protein
MLDEYRALSVALRRPMRRWWRRVGWWWLLWLIMLTLAEGAVRGYIVPWLEAGSQAASASGGGLQIMYLLNIAPQGWLGFADLMLCLGRLLVVCACLLAGAQAMRLALRLQRDFPHPTPGATRRLCFLQALVSGWPFVLTWLALGSSALTYALCTISGRYVTLMGNQPLNAEVYPTSGMCEPWAALVSIVLLLALANSCAEAQTPAWLWAMALCCTPLIESARTALFLLPVPVSVYNMAMSSRFADLPQFELGLGWALGSISVIALFMLYRRKQRVWAGALLGVLLASAVLSGFGGEVPLVHHQQMKQGMDQIGVSSPAGLALVFIRSLSDFPRSALVSYQAFEQRQFSWGFSDNTTPDRAAGALRFYVPTPSFILAPAWARLVVAPLNLAYLLILVYAITAFLLGNAQPGSSLPAKVQPPPRE